MRLKILHIILILCLLLTPAQSRTAGQDAVPYLVRDINSQTSADSQILSFMEAGDVSYFISSWGYSGSGLWKTDGTPDGTKFLKPLYTDNQENWNNPDNYGLLNGTLFFSGCDLSNILYSGCELWKTDGTPEGTVQAADLAPGDESSYPDHFVLMDGKLYFLTYKGLWRLDAADAAPAPVSEIPAQSGLTSIDSGLWALGNHVYFTATDAAHGQELWVSDGTPAGTTYLVDLYPGEGSSYPRPLLVENDRLYFVANNGPSGFDLWEYNPLLGSLHVISDVNAYYYDGLSMLKKMGNLLFFRACEQYDLCRLYMTDGQTSSPLFAQHPEVAPANPFPVGTVQTAAGERLLFFGQDAVSGMVDLWETGGSESSTSILYKSFLPIPGDYGPTYELMKSMVYQGRLYYSNNLPLYGTEPWLSDGTVEGTKLLKDIWPWQAGSHPIYLGNCGERLCFMASDGDHGTELWSTDGSPENTQLMVDINIDAPSSYPFSLQGFGKWVYFAANDGVFGSGLWRTDGMPENTKTIWWNPGSPEVPPYNLIVAGNRLYFVTDDLLHGRELWVYDDSPDGPRLVRDIAPGKASASLSYLTASGDLLFFIANDGIHGEQVWRTDGTNAGTIMLTNLNPGPVTGEVWALLGLDGKAIFFARDYTGGGFHVDLWVTDGTIAGTRTYAQLENVPRYFAKANGKWFFYVFSHSAGMDLPWQTDGTAQGTHSMPAPACLGDYVSISIPYAVGNSIYWIDHNWMEQKDILLKTSGDTFTCVESFPITNGYTAIQGPFYDFNGKAIFTFLDDKNRSHAWVTDGTAEGTHVMPGDPLRAASFRSAGPFLYMRAYTKEAGYEPWVWDGTDTPASLLKDIAPGAENAYPDYFYTWNGKLYFSASDGAVAGQGHGTELWAYDIPIHQVFLPVTSH